MSMFQELDVDGNGQICMDELKSAPVEVQQELESLLNVDSLLDLFEALDVDGSMEVDSDEFFEGMTRLICGNHTLDITRVLKMLRIIRQDIGDLVDVWRMTLPASGLPFTPW